MSREQVVSRPPTPGEVQAMGSMIGRWPEVLQEETQRFFRREAPDRLEEAGSMIREYLLVRCANYFDRYTPSRDRLATGQSILSDLEMTLSEPRGAFRRWVRVMAQWVYRDWTRHGKDEFHVHVVADGDRDTQGVAFERLPSPVDTLDRDEQDAARDIVSALLGEADPDLADDIALFLAAESRGDAQTVYRSFGTNGAAVQRRLQALRPLAQKVIERNAPVV